MVGIDRGLPVWGYGGGGPRTGIWLCENTREGSRRKDFLEAGSLKFSRESFHVYWKAEGKGTSVDGFEIPERRSLMRQNCLGGRWKVLAL